MNHLDWKAMAIPNFIHESTRAVADSNTSMKVIAWYGWLDMVFMIDWHDEYTHDTELDVNSTPWR